MEFLSIDEADEYLDAVGFKIGNWNRLEYKNKSVQSDIRVIQFHAPRGSLELLNFSQRIAGWISQGDWKIFQIDDSTSLDVVEIDFISRLLEQKLDLNVGQSLFFKFGEDQAVNFSNELTIANLIFAFLIFQCHGFLVSSNNIHFQCLSLQDGVVYFSANENSVLNAQLLLDNFTSSPLSAPDWILKGLEGSALKGV